MTTTTTPVRIRNLQTMATVTRTPLTAEELATLLGFTQHRWVGDVGASVTGATLVGVALHTEGMEPCNWNYYIELETPSGLGVLHVGYSPKPTSEMNSDYFNDLMAFVPKGRGAALVWGIFVGKKYGQWRGSIMAYLHAHKRGLKTVCGAEIYNRLAGKGWGSN
mgnify:FL=1